MRNVNVAMVSDDASSREHNEGRYLVNTPLVRATVDAYSSRKGVSFARFFGMIGEQSV